MQLGLNSPKEEKMNIYKILELEMELELEYGSAYFMSVFSPLVPIWTPHSLE